jgi:hypothetical protein
VADYAIFFTTLYDKSSTDDHSLVIVTKVCPVEHAFFMRNFVESATPELNVVEWSRPCPLWTADLLMSRNGHALAHYVGALAWLACASPNILSRGLTIPEDINNHTESFVVHCALHKVPLMQNKLLIAEWFCPSMVASNK